MVGHFWSLFLVLFCFYVFFFDKGELIVFITTDAAGVNGADGARGMGVRGANVD